MDETTITGTKVYRIDKEKGCSSMIYDRKDITGWTVEVVGMSNEDKLFGVFRTAIRDGIECEQFTLLPAKHSDDTIVQVRIYKNGTILTFGLVPVNTVVFKRKKHIEIQLYCDIVIDESGSISFKMHDVYYY